MTMRSWYMPKASATLEPTMPALAVITCGSRTTRLTASTAELPPRWTAVGRNAGTRGSANSPEPFTIRLR